MAYVKLRQRTVGAVMLGTFAVAMLAFVVRAIGQLTVGSDLARLAAAPLFGLALLIAVLAFCLAVLVKLAVVSIEEPE